MKGKQAKGSMIMTVWKRSLMSALTVLLLFVLPARAQNALTVLDIEAGVRALGMGGAFVGVADDETTAFVNPAGLSMLRAMAFEFDVESRFSRSVYGGVTFAGRNFGGGVLFLSVANVTERNGNGDVTGSFDYSGLAGYISAGASLRDLSLTFLRTPPLEELSFGLRTQLYRVNVMPPEGNGFGMSMSPSVLFNLPLSIGGGPIQFLRLGAIIENLLPLGVSYGSGHREPWRIGGRIGASLGLFDALTLAGEFETNGIFHAGAEYRFTGLNTPEISGLAVRGGLIVLRGGPMFTLGFGAKIGTYEMNYAFTGHPELPGSHRLGFTARFANQSFVCLFTGFDELGICDP